jgi:hypothetical protein
MPDATYLVQQSHRLGERQQAHDPLGLPPAQPVPEGTRQPTHQSDQTESVPLSDQRAAEPFVEDVDMQPPPPGMQSHIATPPPGNMQPTDQSSSQSHGQSTSVSGQPAVQQPPVEDVVMQPSQPGMQSPIATPPSGNVQPTDQSSSQNQDQSTSVSGQPTVQQPPVEEDIDMQPSQPGMQSSAAAPPSGNTQQPTNQGSSRSQGGSVSQGSSQFCHTCPRTMHGLHSASNLIAKTFEESFARTAEAVFVKVIESHLNPALRPAATRSSGKRKETATPPQASNGGATDVEMAPAGANGEDPDDEPDDVYQQRRRQRKSRGKTNQLHVSISDVLYFSTLNCVLGIVCIPGLSRQA